ncbi:MAG: dodecin family protein [Rhodospirillales bacterium]|nr:dodecin family protein [Rhodospirillales bacterium]
MANSVYRKIEVVGTSPDSISDAIANALSKAAPEAKEGWFEVSEIRGHITGGKAGIYQVGLKIGIKIEP